MPAKKQPIERRIFPSKPVTLKVEGSEPLTLNITFNFDAIIRVEEKTGLRLLDKSILGEMASLRVLSAALWGAVCENHPEYDSEEGLRSLRSLLTDPDNVASALEAIWESYLVCLPKERREALLRAREEAQETMEQPADPTAPSSPTSASTEPSTGSGSRPSPDTSSGSALASSAS